MGIIRKGLIAVAVAAAALGSAIAFAPGSLATLFAISPGEMRFSSSTAGPISETAVLVGDPAKPGVYVMHARIPANTKVEPHSHSEAWRVATVLSGTLYYGYGATFDGSKMKTLGPGSVLIEPKGQPHFAMTRNEPVTLQLVAEGPAATNPVRR